MDWQTVLQALDVAVVIQEPPDGRITYVNAKAAQLLALDEHELLTRTADDERFTVTDVNGLPVADDGHPGVRALRSGEPVKGVVLCVARPGDRPPIWISATAVPELGPDGSVRRVVVTFADITEYQLQVRAQGAIYRTVFTSMSEGLAIHARDGSIITANAAAERVLGLTEDQMTGRAATDPRWRLVREDGNPVTAAEIPSEVVLATGATYGPQILGVHRPSGDLAWLSVRADPLRDPGDGSLVGAVATFTDVTEARNTQAALDVSRLESQGILAAIPGVVYQYRVPRSGAPTLRIVGGRVREVLGIEKPAAAIAIEDIRAIYTEPDRAEMSRLVSTAVTREEPFRFTARVELADHGPRWLRMIGAPQPVPDGLLFTGVILDVTTEVQLAEALRITQRRESMAQMAAGIAHNFNNLLEVILPNVEMAKERAADDDREMLDDAEQAALQAADLVRRMMELSRAEAGQRDDERCDLVPIVREAVHLARRTLDPSIQILEEVRVPAAPVRGRASTLQQVLLNLLFNARDAVRGAAAPQIAVELRAEGTEAVRLTVRDTGHGIPAALLKRIGEPFFTTKPPGEGTGLGLASVIRAVDEAGGSWDVRSVEGEGTTFDLLFPLRTVPDIVEVDSAPKPVLPRGGTVMVVDDEELVRDVLCRQVTMAGFTPLPFGSAEEALQSLARLTPRDLRCLLLDLSMPGLSGGRALPMFRAQLPDTPIIVISGHTMDAGQLEQANAVLQKPLGFRDLRDTLSRVVSAG